MSTHIPNEEARLLRRRETALKKLEKIAPEDVAAIRAADAGLVAIRTPGHQRYLGIRSTKAAILACLGHEKRGLTKLEIADCLFRGGFPMHPVRGKRLINDSINKGLMRGYLKEDKQGRLTPNKE